MANAALGNGFVSRLNREIRIKRGLSYGAGSSLDPRRETGPFTASAQTKNESAAEVAGLMQAELKRIVSEPVKGDELKSRQAVLTGGYARPSRRIMVSSPKFPISRPTICRSRRSIKFIPSINAVTSEAVTEFARKYLAEPTSLVIVGKAVIFSRR